MVLCLCKVMGWIGFAHHWGSCIRVGTFTVFEFHECVLILHIRSVGNAIQSGSGVVLGLVELLLSI